MYARFSLRQVGHRSGKTLRMCSCSIRSGAVVCRSVDGRLRGPLHTTLSRRSQHLDLALDRIPAQRPVHLIVDSTGLSIVGEGEWAAVKHGNRGKRGWKKLHFGVDRSA